MIVRDHCPAAVALHFGGKATQVEGVYDWVEGLIQGLILG